MKMNIQLIQQILETIEKSDEPNVWTTDISETIKGDDSDIEVFYHLNLLYESGLIDSIKNPYNLDGLVMGIKVKLTMTGHQLLDGFRNDTLKTKIFDKLKTIGVKGLEQMPGLAIQLILAMNQASP